VFASDRNPSALRSIELGELWANVSERDPLA
jgi:hypothetical protein